MIAKIHDISVDYKTRKTLVTLEVDEKPSVIETFKDIILDFVLKKYSEKRSLDANAYFHVLCDKLRQLHGLSMAAMKNELISKYGQIEYLPNGQMATMKTNLEPSVVNEWEYIHMSLVRVDPDAYWYRVYRGSHTYNSKEMSQLIEGTVSDCKMWGIETATPDEIRRMEELWSKKYDRGKQ